MLIPGKRSQTELKLYSTFLGRELETLGSDQGTAYKTKGDFGKFVLSIAQAIDYHFFFAEFGSYSSIRILKELRRENQAHFFSPKISAESERARVDLLECF